MLCFGLKLRRKSRNDAQYCAFHRLGQGGAGAVCATSNGDRQRVDIQYRQRLRLLTRAH